MSEFSTIKGDIPFESIRFDENTEVFITYENEKGEETNKNGRFTAKYRKIRLIENNEIKKELYDENPYFDPEASFYNDKWQRINQKDYYMDAVQIIDEGLSLPEIKERVLNDEEYLVVIWKPKTAPIPIDLTSFKDITLSLIDTAHTIAELSFNVMYKVSQYNEE